MTVRLKICIYFVMALGFLMPSFSYAQGGVFGGSSVQKIPSIQFERNNQYMADLLSLQNQVSLLKKMVDRQKQLNKMAENLSSLNMPFVPPAPEYEICEQLPANDLCAQFYTDLYAGYSFAAALPEPLPLPKLPQIQNSAVAAKNIDELDNDTFKKLEQAEFMWAEINCLNDKCRATVIPDIKDNKSRYTIRVGDKLPNGLVVESISADGVIASRGDKPVTLQPAPSSVVKPEKSIS